jgi:O-antigen/teichoic acid export membrane protein
VTDAATARLGIDPDLRRFAVAVVPTAAAAVLQLATFVLTGRALGPEAFGLVAATYAVAAVAADVAGLGADAAMVRSVAVDPARRAAAWSHALLLMVLSYPPVAIAAIAAATVLAAPTLGFGPVALLVAGEVLVARATAAAELVQVALGRPAAAGLVRLAAVAARATTAALVFALLGATDARTWAAAACAQSALTAALMLGLCGRVRPSLDRAALGFGLLLMLNNLARSLAANLDRIVLATLLPPAALGLYAAGSRLQLVGAVANQAATRILHPRFFRAAEAGPAALAALTRGAGRKMAAVGLLASVGVAVLAPLLPALLGPAFAGTAGIAAGLGLACPFVALQYPPADALTARGHQGLRTAITLAGVLAAALLLAAGAAVAGLAGAVAGFVAGQAALAALLWLAHRRADR